jgi:type II secretory pathway pseudopilin PulG
MDAKVQWLASKEPRKSGFSKVSLAGSGSQGWALIELIAVLAIVAIGAAVLLPAMTKETDKSVGDQEIANLKAFADAFQQYVLASRTIPDATTWYSAVASQSGFGTNDVLYNPRQQSHQYSRVFLIDPALGVGYAPPATPSGLPYYQTNFLTSTNSPMPPVNPRMMIVSSLGVPLPGGVTSGLFGTVANGYFAHLWDAATGTIPSADAVWSGWTGNSADVLVQRINLAPYFFNLQLDNDNSTNNGYYTVDGVAPTTVVTNVNAWLIQGSVLGLYTNSTGLDARHIITKTARFSFQNGVWRGDLSGTALGSGVMNLGDVVYGFMNAAPNVNAANASGNAQQVAIVNDMLSYMSNYNIWASGSTAGGTAFGDSTYKTLLQNIFSTMMTDINGIYSGGNYPTNPGACFQ